MTHTQRRITALVTWFLFIGWVAWSDCLGVMGLAIPWWLPLPAMAAALLPITKVSYAGISLYRLSVPVVASVLLLHVWTQHRIVGLAPLETTVYVIIDLVVVTVSLYLGRLVGRSLAEGTPVHGELPCPPFDTAQALMYREIRRARQYERPVTVMIARIAKGRSRVWQWPVEFHSSHERSHYAPTEIGAKIVEVCSLELSDYALFARRGHELVILVPEVERPEADNTAQRLITAAKEHLDVDLRVGTAVFPEEEVTLIGLLERAGLSARGRVVPKIRTPRPYHLVEDLRQSQGQDVSMPILVESHTLQEATTTIDAVWVTSGVASIERSAYAPLEGV